MTTDTFTTFAWEREARRVKNETLRKRTLGGKRVARVSFVRATATGKTSGSRGREMKLTFRVKFK